MKQYIHDVLNSKGPLSRAVCATRMFLFLSNHPKFMRYHGQFRETLLKKISELQEEQVQMKVYDKVIRDQFNESMDQIKYIVSE
jgi:hypothetical protein